MVAERVGDTEVNAWRSSCSDLEDLFPFDRELVDARIDLEGKIAQLEAFKQELFSQKLSVVSFGSPQRRLHSTRRSESSCLVDKSTNGASWTAKTFSHTWDVSALSVKKVGESLTSEPFTLANVHGLKLDFFPLRIFPTFFF